MNRRGFLAALVGGVAAAADPERLIWRPGRKLISIPSSVRPPAEYHFAEWVEIPPFEDLDKLEQEYLRPCARALADRIEREVRRGERLRFIPSVAPKTPYDLLKLGQVGSLPDARAMLIKDPVMGGHVLRVDARARRF